METKINKCQKNKKISIILLVVVILFLIGITYAYFMVRKSINVGTVNAGDLSMTFTQGTDELILEDATPIYDEEINDKSSYITFSINNTGNMDMYIEIFFKDIVMTKDLENDDFKWRLEESSSLDFTESKVVNEGTFNEIYSDGNIYLIQNEKIGHTSDDNIKYYKVKIWVEETGNDQSAFNNASFSGKISSKGYSRVIQKKE